MLLATTASYVWYSQREFPHGGSRWGLIYGIAGAFLILLLSFFGIRKRWYRSTFGTLEQWLQSHIYLGLLLVVVLLFHTGGRFEDSVAVTTLVLALIVVISGVVGAVVYVTVPRLLTEVESDLTAEQLSDQVNQLGKQMARVATGRSPEFQRVYERLVDETTPRALAGWRLLLSSARGVERLSGASARLVAEVPKGEQDSLRQLLVLSRQTKELLLRLMMQQRYKNIIDFWLYIHVPFTVALLIFSIVHIAGVFYYGRIRW
ncbi:MAG TPA: hypothetical protein VFL80_11340 [Thermoanaerobaculia bacterium]|nr:hypothetical protein [Thermoanaerobaculia bacterium]